MKENECFTRTTTFEVCFQFQVWHVAFIFKFHSENVVEFDPIYFSFEPVMDLDFVFYQFPTKHSVSAAVLKSAAQ